MTPLPPRGMQTLENASSGPTKQILPSSSPIPQPLKLSGSSNHVNMDSRGGAAGAGILAGVSRFLLGADPDALPAAFVTAEVGFGTPGSSGTDANDFHASDLMPLNRPARSYKDSRKAQIEEQQQLRQALFHRYANGNDIPVASDPVEGAAHTRSQDLPDNGAGGRLSSMMASMKSSVAGLMPRTRWETEGHFHGATEAPSAMSNPGWRSLSMNVSRPPPFLQTHPPSLNLGMYFHVFALSCNVRTVSLEPGVVWAHPLYSTLFPKLVCAVCRHVAASLAIRNSPYGILQGSSLPMPSHKSPHQVVSRPASSDYETTVMTLPPPSPVPDPMPLSTTVSVLMPLPAPKCEMISTAIRLLTLRG